MTRTLKFIGPVPSKKNNLRPRSRQSRGPGAMYDKGVKEQMLSLETQARIQWGPQAPVVHPDVVVCFMVEDKARAWRHDRDGMLTTILDVLKKARVIVDDSIQYFNGHLKVEPVTWTERLQQTDVVISWNE